MSLLIKNETYKIKSSKGQELTGVFKGRDENYNILFSFEGSHPFNSNEDGLAVFYLSEYFFIKYFNPICIN